MSAQAAINIHRRKYGEIFGLLEYLEDAFRINDTRCTFNDRTGAEIAVERFDEETGEWVPHDMMIVFTLRTDSKTIAKHVLDRVLGLNHEAQERQDKEVQVHGQVHVDENREPVYPHEVRYSGNNNDSELSSDDTTKENTNTENETTKENTEEMASKKSKTPAKKAGKKTAKKATVAKKTGKKAAKKTATRKPKSDTITLTHEEYEKLQAVQAAAAATTDDVVVADRKERAAQKRKEAAKKRSELAYEKAMETSGKTREEVQRVFSEAYKYANEDQGNYKSRYNSVTADKLNGFKRYAA